MALNAGASPAKLAELSAFLEAPLPDDVQRFYQAADGIADDTDGTDGIVSFWSIDRIVSDAEVRAGSDERGPFRDVAFDDVVLSSWYFFFRVRDGAVAMFSENTAEELPTLSDLLRRYLLDPDSLAI